MSSPGQPTLVEHSSRSLRERREAQEDQRYLSASFVVPLRHWVFLFAANCKDNIQATRNKRDQIPLVRRFTRIFSFSNRAQRMSHVLMSLVSYPFVPHLISIPRPRLQTRNAGRRLCIRIYTKQTACSFFFSLSSSLRPACVAVKQTEMNIGDELEGSFDYTSLHSLAFVQGGLAVRSRRPDVLAAPSSLPSRLCVCLTLASS